MSRIIMMIMPFFASVAFRGAHNNASFAVVLLPPEFFDLSVLLWDKALHAIMERDLAAGAPLATDYCFISGGMSWMLPRLIGLTRAADLLLSSRKAVVAELADWGIFNQVLPAAEVLPAAMAYAQMLVEEVSPASVASTKRQIWLDQHRGAGTAVRDSNRRLDEMMASGEYREGVRALTERRDPDFRSAAREDRTASE